MKKIFTFFLGLLFLLFTTSYAIAQNAVSITVGGGSYDSEISWDITDVVGALVVSGVAGAPFSATLTLGDCYDMNMYDSYGDGWNGGTYSITDDGDGTVYATGGLTSGASGTDNFCLSAAGLMTYVPDDNFEQALINLGYDNVLDDSVLTANINTVTYLGISNSNVTDLTGIEDFIALTNLQCQNNQLTSLDVSNNTALGTLKCSGNLLTTLDISNNISLVILHCASNQLSTIDVTNNIALIELIITENQLSTIDVSQNTALTKFLCGFNQLTSLDVSNNTALSSWLDCSYNQLTTLDVSQNTALTDLQCNNNQLTSLDVSQNTALIGLGCSNNQLTTLDVSANTALTVLHCGNNNLSGNGNLLTSLDVSQNTALTHLICMFSQLTTLDISNNIALIQLLVPANQLTSLDVSNNIALTELYCESNQLSTLDVRNGNNINFSTFNSKWNTNLFCIDVDDPIYSTANWTYIDSWASFSSNCNPIYGCTDSLSCNYDSTATIDDGSCDLPDGCTDPTACNYDASATCDDGSCAGLLGCTDPTACNYDPSANCDDGSCELPDGCTDVTACNYDASATCDDGSCSGIAGCMDPTACNYDPSATCDDGSCEYDAISITIDTTNLQHIACPGGNTGEASILQSDYTNHSWQNISNGTIHLTGASSATPATGLDAGLYVVTASIPSNPLCNYVAYSDTFEIIEAEPVFQYAPTQSCPGECNVTITADMLVAISGVTYTYQLDANSPVSLPSSLSNQCGGAHTYQLFADGIGCGVENISISQQAPMNLSTSVTNASSCTQQGSATVVIESVGSSGLDTYCDSEPQFNNYTTIDNVLLVGNTTTISNNTFSIPDKYTDYTSLSADLDPGSSYNLNIDLGSESTTTYLENIANVYIDWNIDGVFDAVSELVGQVGPTQSPSSHTISITVPATAIPGQSRMRIVAQDVQNQPGNQAGPCDYSAWFGSTEDYTIQVNGSVAAPVTYLWNDPLAQTTATANLGAGTYTVTITDANGCTATDTAIVTGLVFGCTDPTATNYNVLADCDDGTCATLCTDGCMDPSYVEYDPSATCDDGTCVTLCTDGCMDNTFVEYDPLATCDDGSCATLIVYGCTNSLALNFDPLANTDDGSCTNCYAVADIEADSIIACDSTLISTNPITNGTYLWNSSNISSSSANIGDSYGGGIVFYLYGSGNTNGGLIAAPTDQATNYTTVPWGCMYTVAVTGTGIGTGAQNTTNILNCAGAGTAAYLCANLTLGGYSDWWLPSKDELNEMYLSNVASYNAYWSSSETSWTRAWMIDYNNNGSWGENAKNNGGAVRAIRSVGNFLSNSTYTTNSVMVSTSGWNYVTVTDSLGCTATDSVYVSIGQITGCTDSTAWNYNSNACWDDGSCVYSVYGCTDSLAFNYDPLATIDDSSCIATVFGCMDSTQFNYNVLANTDDGSCISYVYGCMDSTATNYNLAANTDDGSCTNCYAVADIGTDTITACDSVLISTNPITNGSYLWNTYNPSTSGNFSIGDITQGGIYCAPGLVCLEYDLPSNSWTATNGTVSSLNANGYNDWILPSQNQLASMCANKSVINAAALSYPSGLGVSFQIGGCDWHPGCPCPCSDWYWSNESYQSSKHWLTDFSVCTPHPFASQYGAISRPVRYCNSSYTILLDITNNLMVSTSGWNYVTVTDSLGCTATDSVYVNVGVCGCTDPTAFNYDPIATIDDSSCIATVFGCMDSTMINYNVLANTDDGSCISFVYGCMDSTMFNYNVLANTDDGSCMAIAYGCTDSLALNFDPLANTDDSTCCGAGISLPPFGTQIGQDIDGETAGDWSGRSVSISADGNIVASGASLNDGNGSNSGHVRVFENINGSWTQLGQDIDGEASEDQSGHSVSLSSDGNIVAIGALDNDGNGSNSGHVRIYEFNGSSWNQLGNDIDGEASEDQSGHSVSLSSDGNIVAIGAPDNDGNGNRSGHVRIYNYNGTSWTQLGQDIDGEAAGDESGFSVSLSSDGNTVAISSPNNDANGVNLSGHVRIYNYNGSSWVQLGGNIEGANIVYGYFGRNGLSLSDNGNTVAIGSTTSDGTYIESAGRVRVYNYNSNSWVQLGQEIAGQGSNDQFGYSVSLSGDGNIVAIGGPYNSNVNGNYSGHLRVYNYNGNLWNQLGFDINGDTTGDNSAESAHLSGDGNTVAIGARRYDNNLGHVRVFSVGDGTQYTSPPCSGCTDSLAVNYDPYSLIDDGTCDYLGCTDSLAFNYDPLATIDDSSCIATVFGCMDSTQFNYNALANTDDGSCIAYNYGCIDSTQFNYNLLANTDDGSCIPFVYGCMDSLAANYDVTANTDDGTCTYCNFLAMSLSQTPVSCSGWNDGTVSANVIGGTPPYNYTWNIGDNTSQIDNLTEGVYILTVNDGICSLTDSILVGLNTAPADSMHPEICYVSVDNTGFNRVVLKPLANPLTASYVIYSQYSANLYAPLDTIDSNTLEYIDSTSNPAAQAERYRVSAIDACGNGTDTSDYHKTVHLTMSLGVNGEVNLIWNSYEGYQVTDYLIYRGNSASNMNMIATTPGNNVSFTDLTPPTGYLMYQIRAFAQNCDAIPNASMLPDTLESNIIDHNNTNTNTLTVSISSQDPSCVSCSDGYAVATASNGTSPYTYFWSNNIAGAFNVGIGVGTYTVFVSDADGNVVTASVTLTVPLYGCTDPTATNYDPSSTIDDGSCTYSSSCTEPAPTGLNVTDIVHNRVTINWNNMNDTNCTVDQYRIKYRAVGTSSWSQKNMGTPLGSCTWPCNKTDKLILGLSAGTTYEYQMRAWYCGGGNSSWTTLYNFTTLDACPNIGNLVVTTPTTTKATFTWDDSNGPYSFVRLKSRVDTIVNPSGSDWFNIGGAGVVYPTFTKDKNNLTPGQSYRAQARTWCDPTGGPYKSDTWTSLVYWTMPTSIRIEGGKSITHLDVYPNPSRDIFNISFTSEQAQNLKVRILNVIGEELISDDLQQFIGEYTKQIDLTNNAKGIYFLEIETDNGVINKKLILQ